MYICLRLFIFKYILLFQDLWCIQYTFVVFINHTEDGLTEVETCMASKNCKQKEHETAIRYCKVTRNSKMNFKSNSVLFIYS